MKLSKTQLGKAKQSGGFQVKFQDHYYKIGLSIIGNVLKLSAKSVLIPLGLTAAVSATV